MSIQFDKNTVVSKTQELSGEIINLRKWYFWSIKVSAVLCVQQSIVVCYDELFLLICSYASWEWEFIEILCKLYTFAYMLKPTHKILLWKAWISIWCRCTGSYMKCDEWKQWQDIGLLSMMSTYWVIHEICWMKATPGYWVAKYDADVLNHTWNVLIEGNARILSC